MTASSARERLLEEYGRLYGAAQLAIAFTQSMRGEAAKKCTTTGWPSTRRLSSPEEGAKLLARHGKRRNPVVVLGASGLVGIECDSEARLEQIRALELPKTVTIRSSEPHKLHFWFRPPNDACEIACFRFEETVTADRVRNLVAPPGRHPSGTSYEFVHSLADTPIATLPEAAYQELVRIAEASRGEEPIESADSAGLASLLADPPSEEGSRNEWLTRVAGHYARAFDRWDAFEKHVLDASALTTPSMDRAEALTTARSIWRSESDKYERDVQREARRQRVVADARRRVRAEQDAGLGRIRVVRTLAEAIEVGEEPTDWVVPYLLAAEEKVIIAAPPKAFKTWLALGLASAIATGGRVLSEAAWEVADPQPVLFVQEEGNEQRWGKRLKTVFDGRPEAPFFPVHKPGISLLSEFDVEWVIAEALRVGARAIFFDPLQRMVPGANENDSTEFAPAWAAIHEIARETKAAPIVLHHAKKTKERPSLDMIRGTSRHAGEVDLAFVSVRRERRKLEMLIEGRDLADRDEDTGETFQVLVDRDSPNKMRIDRVFKGPRSSARESLEPVLISATRALTPRELAEAVGRSESTISRTLRELQQDGLVKREKVRGKAYAWRWCG